MEFPCLDHFESSDKSPLKQDEPIIGLADIEPAAQAPPYSGDYELMHWASLVISLALKQTIYHLAQLVNIYHHTDGIWVSQVCCQGHKKVRLDQNLHRSDVESEDHKDTSQPSWIRDKDWLVGKMTTVAIEQDNTVLRD